MPPVPNTRAMEVHRDLSQVNQPQRVSSVTIWNVNSWRFTPVKILLKKRKTVFDSGRKSNVLGRLFSAFRHGEGRNRLKIAVEEIGSYHVVRVLSSTHSCFFVRNGVWVREVAIDRGVQLVHGDQIKIYYKLADTRGSDFVGPFAFEYLRPAADLPSVGDLELFGSRYVFEENPKVPMQEPVNFLDLPNDVLQRILSHVPANDLLFNVSQVCSALNGIVGNGIQVRRFGLPHNTSYSPEEEAAFERIMRKAPPKTVVIGGFWGRSSYTSSHFILEQVTKSAERVTLITPHEEFCERDEIRNFPLCCVTGLGDMLLLPFNCVNLTCLELRGPIGIAWWRDDFVLPNLEELWIQGGFVKLSAVFGPSGVTSFPKLTSVGVAPDTANNSGVDNLPARAFDRVQLSFVTTSAPFDLISSQVETLKMEIASESRLECEEMFQRLEKLENLSLFFCAGKIEAGEIEYVLSCVPTTVKFLQLSMNKLTEGIVKTIGDRFSAVEYLLVCYRHGLPTAKLKPLTSEAWKGVGHKVLRAGGDILVNEWVEENVRRTEDFWAKKVYGVFGPIDTFDLRMPVVKPCELWVAPDKDDDYDDD